LWCSFDFPVSNGTRGAATQRPSNWLPDVDPLLGRQIEFVAGLHVERFVPGVDVPDDAVDPIFVGAVRVGQNLLTLGIFTILALPRLSVSKEEALVAGQAVDNRRFAVLGSVFLIRRIGRLDTAQVAEILAQRQLAVDGDAWVGAESTIMLGQCVSPRGIALGRRRGPPFVEFAGRPEFAALIVEAVAHFVADDR